MAVMHERPQAVRARVSDGDRLRRPFIAVYRSPENDNFFIYAGRRTNFMQEMPFVRFRNLSIPEEAIEGRLKLVSLKRVPLAWSKDINAHIQTGRTEGVPVPVGYIAYTGMMDIAAAEAYYPRSELPDGSAKRIDCYIEAITAKRMLLDGKTLTYAGFGPSESRIAQLAGMGIGARSVVGMKEWLVALGKGIKEHVSRT